MTKEMEQLYAERDALRNKLKNLNVADNFDDAQKVIDEINALDKKIDVQEAKEKLLMDNIKLDDVKPDESKNDKTKFKSFAEQLRAVRNAAISNGRIVDPRLVQDVVSENGMNTENDKDGGYAIQSDFVGNILDLAFEGSEILNRCQQKTVTKDSNRANWVELADENDATKDGVVVAGGAYAAWTKEGGEIPISKRESRGREAKLGKITGAAIVTEEMLEDVPFTAQLLNDAFADAVAGLWTDGVLNGKGEVAGQPKQPLGIFNSKAVVSVAKKDAEVSAEDLLAIKSRMRKKNWARAAWFMHPDLEEILPLMADKNGNPLYIPAGGLSGSQYDTFLGRPVIFDEFLPAKGEYGEVLLADFSEYLLLTKGGERRDWSMHVRFLNDEQVYRVVLRAGGAPLNDRVFSVKHSANKRGAFVALGTPSAARSAAKSSGSLN